MWLADRVKPDFPPAVQFCDTRGCELCLFVLTTSLCSSEGTNRCAFEPFG